MPRPSETLPVQILQDGNQVCVLWGRDLQEGVGGFGDTLEQAKDDFDKN